MTSPYLTWWVAGLGLGTLAVAQWILDRRPLGVSGLIDRALRGLLQPEREHQARRVIEADPQALRRALAAATAEEFGVEVKEEAPAPRPATPATPRLVTGRGALMFVLAIAAGGLIASLQRGTFGLSTSLGPLFEARFGDGLIGALALVGGGILVGFGTQMAGGCTSGHGLTGCARLQRASILATTCFLGAAVVVNQLLRGLG